ncbi:MAG: FAD-dependent thymidylate synthase [Caldisericia bacterium]|nr:FAD-dependent thymidylate synthase [Caldisericia bacterium]
MDVKLIYITPNPEKIIEEAGRTAHESFDRLTPDSHVKFIRMLLKLGHESVLEHAVASFRISGVSRSLTHQLVRHRIASYTQKSQRYVNESNFDYVIPYTILANNEALIIYKDFMERTRDVYKKLINLGIPKEDARFVLPNATKTEIVLTANFRELRHMIKLRGSKEAQWEIRNVFIEILKILKEYAPTVFEDFVIEKDYIRIRDVKE